MVGRVKEIMKGGTITHIKVNGQEFNVAVDEAQRRLSDYKNEIETPFTVIPMHSKLDRLVIEVNRGEDENFFREEAHSADFSSEAITVYCDTCGKGFIFGSGKDGRYFGTYGIRHMLKMWNWTFVGKISTCDTCQIKNL